MNIPKTFHRIWIGGEEPDWLKELGQTWKDFHPDWVHMQWGDDNLPPLRNQELYDRAAQFYRNRPAQLGQFRADLLRYELVHDHGGVYVDADFEACRPLDDLLEGVEAFVAWESPREVNNAIIGAVPEHPFLADLITSVEKVYGQPRNVTGPRYITTVLQRHPEVTVFDQALFYPYRPKELHMGNQRFPKAYAIHHWNNRRQMRDEQLERSDRPKRERPTQPGLPRQEGSRGGEGPVSHG